MSKKKILSILIISLIVLGVFSFVLTNYLHADSEKCTKNFEKCASWCATHGGGAGCSGICEDRYVTCLDR